MEEKPRYKSDVLRDELDRMRALVQDRNDLICAMQAALGIRITDGTDWIRERLVDFCRRLRALADYAHSLQKENKELKR